MPEPQQHSQPSSEVGQMRRESAGGALALMLALLALTLLLVVVRHRPPAPKPAGAPATEFSGERAREVQRQLVGDGRPHPVGSAADDRVRQVVVATLSGLGYQPRVEEGFACHWGGTCARVRNVVAQLDGREAGAAVAVAAHYDSVDAGPGASDDLAGVAAILEIARALKASPPPLHPVLLLLDEGEETGLLGATAFVDSSPEAAAVKAVVNLEARGTEGPSFMFETSGDDAWLIDAWAPRAPRPVTTSLAAFIYAQLPNDTDLTVFRHHHVPGLNFAFIGAATRYHTPEDSLANSSPASLQHQGDCALAAVAGLADSPLLASPPRGNLAFFDLLGLGVVRWPLGWTLPLALAALILLVAVTGVALSRRALGGGELVLGMLALPATALAAALLAWCLSQALQAAGALTFGWPAHPLPVLVAFWLLPLAVAAGLAWMLAMGHRAAPLGLWSGVWIVWSAIAVALALRVPAVSYIFVLPALAAAVCGLLGRVWRGGGAGAAAGPPAAPRWPPAAAVAIVPGLVAAVLWWGVLPPIYDGLGAPALTIIAVLLAILYSTLAPLVAGGGKLGRRLWAVALAATLVAVAVALPQAPYSRQSPQAVTYTFYQDGDSGAARWVVRASPPVPKGLRHAGEFARSGPPFPWSSPDSRPLVAPAPPLAAAAAPAPELQVLENTVIGGKRHLRLLLLSKRGARIATLWVPASAKPESVTIEGHAVPDTGWRRAKPQWGPADWVAYSDATLPPAGCEVQILLGDTGPVVLYAMDSTPGLPPSGAALLAARPPSAVPQQQGDTTLVSRKLKI